MKPATDQGGLRAAPAEEAPERMQQSFRILLMHVDCLGAMRARYWEPRGRRGREAPVRLPGYPRHWRAASVAPAEFGPVRDAERIPKVLSRQLGLGQAEFLALVKRDAAS